MFWNAGTNWSSLTVTATRSTKLLDRDTGRPRQVLIVMGHDRAYLLQLRREGFQPVFSFVKVHSPQNLVVSP